MKPRMENPVKTGRMNIRRYHAIACFSVIGIWALAAPAGARADIIGPVLGYQSFSDSPFSTMNFSSFQLVKMSDLPVGFVGPSLVPGVQLYSGGDGQIYGPSSITDSVDGQGGNGNSLFSASGSPGFTFTFDASVLGSLPTAAGIVWTDGILNIHFSAIDANGNTIGSITDNTGCDYTCGDGATGYESGKNYRFFGVTDALGIKSISISNDSGGIEVDHLQFGVLAPTAAVPEPDSLLTLSAALCLLCLKFRRRAARATCGR